MLILRRTNSDNPEFQDLVRQLDRELAIINGDSNDFFAQYNRIDQIKHAVVAFQNNLAVGCGAIKEFDPGTMEIKRMYVPVELRGKGIATTVLQELEQWAAELGYHRCILETGKQMPDAIGLYRKNGYQVIPNYGQYKKVESSICFDKVVSRKQ